MKGIKNAGLLTLYQEGIQRLKLIGLKQQDMKEFL